jgi:hypothetical protein
MVMAARSSLLMRLVLPLEGKGKADEIQIRTVVARLRGVLRRKCRQPREIHRFQCRTSPHLLTNGQIAAAASSHFAG